MRSHRTALLASFSVLVLAIVACTINVGGLAYPAETIPVSTEAVGELTQSIQTAVAAGAESGEITMVVTEPQLTSYLAYQLSTQTNPILTKPQVYLRNGQIQIYGTAQQGDFLATISITISAGVDAQGQLLITLTSIDFGPLPVPAGLNGIITSAIQEAYTGALGPVATGFRLESITIAEGTMTIVGRTK